MAHNLMAKRATLEQRSRRLTLIVVGVLVFAGVVAIATSALMTWAVQGTLAHWLLLTTFTAERLLPLVGAGLLLGQMPLWRWPVAAALLVAGIATGLPWHDELMQVLAPLPGAPTHFFLVGPLACLLAGLLLVLPPSLRFWPSLLVMPVLGAALALAVDFSDPTFHDRTYLPWALVTTVWVLLTAGLVAGIFTASWTMIASRVFGSWLLAIGALYGGAYMASKQTELVPPPFVAPPVISGSFPGFDPILKSFERWGPRRRTLQDGREG
ncbi:hypothetical protein [Rhizobium oryziradicis]|uniref:Uncharacterized protein n=1 Tax=Rhizobium oryziradicis TaxID=1867956 RepID=A0A1Q8ZUL5_9HYPH|nr:hypothetical protein [Rhizobium oryziradicis]OLP45764.1 hypothetical protein BJF95_11635 [Rhizobium oryziradicis]